jgi:hypothetical protein
MATSNLALIENNSSDYVIVIPKDADRTLNFAAEEIQKYIGKISGIQLPIKKLSSSHSGSSIKISIGSLNVTDPEPGGIERDAFTIKTKGKSLFIKGINARSALFGVYHFLEILGCRWLAPDFDFYKEHHEFVPKKRKVIIQPLDIFERAHSLYREGNFMMDFYKYWLPVVLKSEEFKKYVPKIIDWCAKNKINIFYTEHDFVASYDFVRGLKKRGLLFKTSGHSYWRFLFEIGDPPNEFLPSPKGRLKRLPLKWLPYSKKKKERIPDSNCNFCTSNKDAQEKLVKNILFYLKKHPEVDIFGLWSCDGGSWCECPECEAQGNPPTRKAKIVNIINTAIKKHFPHVKSEFTIYDDNYVPDTEISQDALGMFCPMARCYRHAIDYTPGCVINSDQVALLERWLMNDKFKGDIMVYTYYRKLLWDTLPFITPKLYSYELQWFHNQGLKGLSWYLVPADWIQYELTHYTLPRLAWNNEYDITEWVKDYCKIRYGASSKIMEKYYSLLESTMRLLYNGGALGLHYEGLMANPEVVNEKVLSDLKLCKRYLNEAFKNQHLKSAHKWHIEKMKIIIDRTIIRVESIFLEQKEDFNKALKVLKKEEAFFDTYKDKGLFLYDIKEYVEIQIDIIKKKT